MNVIFMRAILLLTLVLTGTVKAEIPLTETRSTLEKWVETRQLISKARNDWRTDKETIEQTIQLYERELKSIDEQMSKVSTNNTQIDKERSEAEAQKKIANASLDRAREFVAGFEAQVKKLSPQLPAPLQEILTLLLHRMPSDAATKMSTAERMQVVVGVLNEMDKFNNSVSVFNEKRKNAKGEEVAVETVYVGLGAAYFVNQSNDFAGTGTPGANGWEWTTKPELASAVRDAIKIYRNEQPAHFVSLPVVLR